MYFSLICSKTEAVPHLLCPNQIAGCRTFSFSECLEESETAKSRPTNLVGEVACKHIDWLARDNSMGLQTCSKHVPIRFDCSVHFSALCFESCLGTKNYCSCWNFHLKLGKVRTVR